MDTIIVEERYENGQMMYRANYKNGKLDGTYEGWDSNGKLIEFVNYKNGHKVPSRKGQ